MNKSRRMVARQARAFAALGGVTAVLDPRGTGDSAGDHGIATWEGWRDDAGVAWQWLKARQHVPAALWGLRLGALLALDVITSGGVEPDALLLWQPVPSGKSWFNQFLRLVTAQQITGTGEGSADAKALRAALASGVTIEVAGYDLNPLLAFGAEAMDLGTVTSPRCTTILREVTISASPTLSPVAERAAARWSAAGTQVDALAVEGPSFWSSLEIAEAPNLLEATTTVLAEALQPEHGDTLGPIE